MSTIKVLHVIARMNVGGTARYVEELVKNIPNSALATGYVQDAEVEDSAVESLPVIRIQHLGRKISPIADFKAWRELSKVVREQKPAIIHTHTFKAGLIGRFIPGNHVSIHTFHGHLFADSAFNKIEKIVIALLERILAKRSDYLISVGEKVGSDLRNAKVGSNQKWAAIAPGVDPLATIAKREARQVLGLQESHLLFGWMARITSVKNPFLFLELAHSMPHVQFVMAGGGDLYESIKVNAPNNLVIIGWVDAALFWSAIDIAISTSSNEGMPIALIEAQLAGIPVIATDVGSSSEVVENDVTGYIVGTSVAKLASAVNRFLISPSLVSTLGKNAKKLSAKKFTIEKMIESHISLYDFTIDNFYNP